MIRVRWPALLAWLALGCTDVSTELVPVPTPAAGTGHDAAVPLADAGTSSGHCGGHACACNDGLDQDGDDLVDGLDPECTGPYDDDESSFASGLGGSLDFCQDCYWDGNTDSSDDGCAYSTDCLFGATPGATAPASCASCDVSAQCEETCRASTPNGCDCFGCCGVATRDGPVYVLLSDSCSLREVQDEEKCPRCVQSDACLNPCGTCELCPGLKRKDLPIECRGQGRPPGEDPMNVCDEGQAVCSEEQPCPRDYYCQLGCCLFVLQ